MKNKNDSTISNNDHKSINKSIGIIPVITYTNTLTNKSIIYKENKGKCGIYRWTNLINKKSYVGSSISLSRRLSDYYSINRL